MKGKKRYQILITEEVMKQFKHLCLDKGINTSQMIEKLIIEKLRDKKKPAMKDLKSLLKADKKRDKVVAKAKKVVKKKK